MEREREREKERGVIIRFSKASRLKQHQRLDDDVNDDRKREGNDKKNAEKTIRRDKNDDVNDDDDARSLSLSRSRTHNKIRNLKSRHRRHHVVPSSRPLSARSARPLTWPLRWLVALSSSKSSSSSSKKKKKKNSAARSHRFSVVVLLTKEYYIHEYEYFLPKKCPLSLYDLGFRV